MTELKTFRIKANFEFKAEDIDDALLRLAEHYRKLVEDENYAENNSFVCCGETDICPI